MNPATLEALKSSIAHWERMRDDPNGPDKPYAEHCALCVRFDVDICELLDEKCPVHKKSGQLGCIGTPYKEARAAFWNLEVSLQQQIWQAAAQAEINFLKSLLPNETNTQS